MDSAYKEKLKKQHYRIIGEHSAVKTCTWTKRALRNEGVCYKSKFYGIKSHRCIQMTPSLNFCDMDCLYCWRERNNSPFDIVDDPKELLDNAIKAQRKLLNGNGGYDKTDKKQMEESKKPLHVAISLNGEPLYYPKLSEFIKEIKKRNMTSFLVTNGQLPSVLEKIELPTQMYISLDAPNPELQKKITRSIHTDSWERLMKSLDILASLKGKTRTAVRLTLVKGLNDNEPEKYAELFKKANPDFIEIKSYMFVGASRQRLKIENMPYYDDVKNFAQQIEKYCDYKIIDEQKISRVVLMTKKDSAERFIEFKDLK
ncbi:MAG: 4-demethylwyosine synthase TYW1 [Candidatus Woesearchaeota archaeon]